MERFTALLAAEPYLWITITAVALGGIVALVTTPARRRRYPLLFSRRRPLLVLLLAILAVVAATLSLFVPGPPRFPEPTDAALYAAVVLTLSGLFFRFPRSLLPAGLLLVAISIRIELRVTSHFVFPQPDRKSVV